MILAEPRGGRHRQSLGEAGELAAEDVLRRAGMRILERRFRRRGGEIDLVAEDGETLVVVEVKTRAGAGYGTPAEGVTATKRRRLARTALAWLQRHDALERSCRFDVVELEVAGKARFRARHLSDAFRLWPTG